MRRYGLSIAFMLLLVVMVVLTAGQLLTGKRFSDTAFNKPANPNLYALKDGRFTYADEKDDASLYITLAEANKQSFEEMCLSNETIPLRAYVQEGKSESILAANATVKARGQVRNAAQRSFGVSFDKNNDWNGQLDLNLNKYIDDPTRIKEKFCLEVIRDIPNMLSMRCTLVHVYLRDLSVGDTEYRDMGLYTHVEQLNGRYLSSHSLYKKGLLYEAENFDFSTTLPSKLALLSTDGYRDEVLEPFLKVRQGSEDKHHSELLDMLKAVNDPGQDIDTVVDKYFQRDNLVTYTAVSLLLGQPYQDKSYCMYYNGKNKLWYLFPTDFADALFSGDYPVKKIPPVNLIGLPVYSENVLLRRFFSKQDNLKALDTKMAAVYRTLMNNRAKHDPRMLLDGIASVLTGPDKGSMLFSEELTQEYVGNFYNIMKDNFEVYRKQRMHPVSPYLTGVIEGKKLQFSWQAAQGITYTLQIAKNIRFDTPIYTKAGIASGEYTINLLPPGGYFYRVIARDSKGNTQYPGNLFIDPNGKKHFGVAAFQVKGGSE